ncbi:hypothetical protein ABTZ03_13045 [Kitasatospora sp. NPDC096077]|uniref:hypothetical protein n=1 Tax=Kitasatospora sp. NPDC096077 TaxID=3155544 RepID=UPI0033310179
MDAELVQEMVKSGATALAGLMAKAAWGQASSRVARMFGRGERDEEATAELEVIRAEVLEAGDNQEVLADQTAALRNRLRALFRENPEAIDELRDILGEFSPQETTRIGTIHNEVSKSTIRGNVIQTGTGNARF